MYGTGGSLGFRNDGSHSQYLELGDASLVTEKPSTLSHDQAGTVGVPYFTAYEAIVNNANLHEGEVIVVQKIQQ